MTTTQDHPLRTPMASAQKERPLSGVRILEWGGWEAAIAGRICAALGAEVCTVEPREGRPPQCDALFTSRAPLAKGSFTFCFARAGKSSVTLPEHIGLRYWLDHILANVDAVITAPSPHFRPADQQALLDTIERTACSVWIRIDPYETPAANSHAPARLWAEQKPPRPGLDLSSIVGIRAAASCVLGLLRAPTGYVEEIRTEETQHELLDLFGLASPSHYWDRGFQVLPARDGWIATTILGNWPALAHAVLHAGGPAWLVDPSLEDPAQRYERAEEIFRVLSAWCRSWKAGALTRWAQTRRIPFARVRSPVEVCTTDRHLRQRRFFVGISCAVAGGNVRVPRVPIRFRNAARAQSVPSPPAALRDNALWKPRRAFAPATGGGRLASPLGGTTVVDFTHAVAGPLATQLLRRYGAQVVQIEHPERPSGSPLHPQTFAALRQGKEVVRLDPASEAGRQQLLSLLGQVDIVTDNFSVRVMHNWGLEYALLKRVNPELVQTRMTGFGLTGPYRHWVAYAPTLHAWAGHTWLFGTCDGSGWRDGWPFPYADVVTGLFGFLGTVVALWIRQRRHTGSLVDVSGYECAVFALGPLAVAAANPELWPDFAENHQHAAESPGRNAKTTAIHLHARGALGSSLKSHATRRHTLEHGGGGSCSRGDDVE